ncbi:MAG TPA: DNA polymerase ligase N-terminal domain-containing protein [Phycisphaerae bacterium]|nr:DNA polymerase ligase N-terminal domain-containing protein [Phycisphaerae bacterium]
MNKPAETRFVTLHHTQKDGSHFDLMILRGEKLATWKFVHPPESGGPVNCERLPDHRTMYLDYEGPVSNDRGNVMQHDQGTCTIESWADSRIEINFNGVKLTGRCTLTRSDPDQPWRFSRLDE